MKKCLLNELQNFSEGHILNGLILSDYLYKGGVTFYEPGMRSHNNDGPNGSDYHVHDDYEFFIILQGRGMIEVNQVQDSISSGDVIVIEPGEEHHLISDQVNPLVTLHCHAGSKRNKS